MLDSQWIIREEDGGIIKHIQGWKCGNLGPIRIASARKILYKGGYLKGAMESNILSLIIHIKCKGTLWFVLSSKLAQ